MTSIASAIAGQETPLTNELYGPGIEPFPARDLCRRLERERNYALGLLEWIVNGSGAGSSTARSEARAFLAHLRGNVNG